ncbi:unnamed protein product [Gemmata massiliana]|uniref:Uncharacterized protein n=1 Tax=Gemmata massiliana TaxID=1210884 RepID=A0A6P2CYH6_9BACT|nr:hypothetical protein [Gemmata massiliana]VTR93165.1 unnamed protein product [Gemmata massiliana]
MAEVDDAGSSSVQALRQDIEAILDAAAKIARPADVTRYFVNQLRRFFKADGPATVFVASRLNPWNEFKLYAHCHSDDATAEQIQAWSEHIRQGRSLLFTAVRAKSKHTGDLIGYTNAISLGKSIPKWMTWLHWIGQKYAQRMTGGKAIGDHLVCWQQVSFDSMFVVLVRHLGDPRFTSADIQVIREVVDKVCKHPVLKRITNRFAGQPPLSEKHARIRDLLLLGYSNSQVNDKLNGQSRAGRGSKGLGTTKDSVSAVLKAYGISDRAQLALAYIRHGGSTEDFLRLAAEHGAPNGA